MNRLKKSAILTTFFLLPSQLTDVLFAELPRVRIDRQQRTRKTIWEPPQPTLHEEVEDENGTISFNNQSNQHIELNSTLRNGLGE